MPLAEEVRVGVPVEVAVVEGDGVSDGVFVGVAPTLFDTEEVCVAEPVPEALEVTEDVDEAVPEFVTEEEGVFEGVEVEVGVVVLVPVCEAVVVGVEDGVAGAMRGSTGGSATERQRVSGTGLAAMGAARPSPVVAE